MSTEISPGINCPKVSSPLCSFEICWHSVTSYTHAPLHTRRSSHVSNIQPAHRGRFQSGYRTRLACHSSLTCSLFLGCLVFTVFYTLALPLDHLPTVMRTVCNGMPLLTFIIYSDAEHSIWHVTYPNGRIYCTCLSSINGCLSN